MNLENSIKDAIAKKLEDGTVEKLIAEQLENGIKNALKDLLGSYGDVTKIIEKQVKSVMIPYLESYDYSQYITKLDSVLVDVLKSTALENKNLLENFRDLMISETEREIKVTDLFEQWMKYVSENVETDGLEINYEEEPIYESVTVSFHVDYNEERSWSEFEHAILVFECEHDEEMNAEIKIHRWKKFDKDRWTIDYDGVTSLNSLRYLGKFKLLLMQLKQNDTKIIIDRDYDESEVEPKRKPEVTFE